MQTTLSPSSLVFGRTEKAEVIIDLCTQCSPLILQTFSRAMTLESKKPGPTS